MQRITKSKTHTDFRQSKFFKTSSLLSDFWMHFFSDSFVAFLSNFIYVGDVAEIKQT